MKTQDYSEIRKLLKKKRAFLLQTDRDIDRDIKDEVENRHGDDMDLAEADAEQEISFFLKSKAQDEIRLIDEALERIDQKEYGICAECGEDIPQKRLKVQPYTIYCVDCLNEMETSQEATRE